MDLAKKAFVDYINAASDLAESVKDDIKKSGVISDETVLALNAFLIATNAVAYLTEDVENKRVN